MMMMVPITQPGELRLRRWTDVLPQMTSLITERVSI